MQENSPIGFWCCGSEDEVVAYEYSLTEIGLPAEWKSEVIQHLMGNEALKDNMEGALNMIGAKYVSCGLDCLAANMSLQGRQYVVTSKGY